jgi:plasmid stabilization system protein ParE
MILLRRSGFIAALTEGIRWYSSQDEHGPEAATQLAERFAAAVDVSVSRIARNPELGLEWSSLRGYRFVIVRKPFHRWLIFYRQPNPTTVELVDIVPGARDLPRRVK